MSNTFPLTTPPPPPVSFIVVQPSPSPATERSSSVASSLVIVIIIIASAVIASATIYILLRFLSRRFHRSFRTFAAADDIVHPSAPPSAPSATAALLDRLPLFQFGSVTGSLAGGDCAVCLSKFEPRDQLRLLPLCCHAFHADCIDGWIVANQTCPLCRSAIDAISDSDILDKLAAAADRRRSGSFRVEIGSVSRRRDGSAAASDSGRRRSFSIGSFEYVLDGTGHEVPAGSTTTNNNSIHRAESAVDDKEAPAEAPGGGARNWLRDYVDRLGSISMSSRAMSFRSSGRFFSGSSRRSEVAVAVAADDLEANRVGEEISELFRWLSGI